MLMRLHQPVGLIIVKGIPYVKLEPYKLHEGTSIFPAKMGVFLYAFSIKMYRVSMCPTEPSLFMRLHQQVGCKIVTGIPCCL